MIKSCLNNKEIPLFRLFPKARNFVLPIGLLSFSIAILIKRFLPSTNVLDFIQGFLLGLSIVANIFGILIICSDRSENNS